MRSIKYRVITLLLCVAFCCTLWPVSAFAAIEDIESVADLLTDIILGTYETDEESNSDPTAPATDGTASTDNSDSAPDGTADSSPANGSTQENTPADSTEISNGTSDNFVAEPDSTGDSSENAPETSPEPATDATSTDSSSTDTSTATPEPTETVPECTCGTETEIHTTECELEHCTECGYSDGHLETCSQYVVVSDTSGSVEIPEHDCDTQSDLELNSHNDACSRKVYCKTLADKHSAKELYDMWGDLPEDIQEFILIYLSWGQNDKLSELNTLIENGTTDPDVEDKDASFDGGETLTVSDVPENIDIIADYGSDADFDNAETYISEDNPDLSVKYIFDISFTDGWQPNGTEVTVSLENLSNINLGEAIYIYHFHGDSVSDETFVGTISEFDFVDGTLTFNVDQFSTFVIASGNTNYGPNVNRDAFVMDSNHICYAMPGTTITFYCAGSNFTDKDHDGYYTGTGETVYGTATSWKVSQSSISGLTNGGKGTDVSYTVVIPASATVGSTARVIAGNNKYVDIEVVTKDTLIDKSFALASGEESGALSFWYDVYWAIIVDSTKLPAEPGVNKYYFNYVTSDGTLRRTVNDKTEGNKHSTYPENVFKEDIIKDYLVVSSDGTNTLGLVDYSNVDNDIIKVLESYYAVKDGTNNDIWDSLLKEVAELNDELGVGKGHKLYFDDAWHIYIYKATDGSVIQDNNKNAPGYYENYQIVPYVVKLQTASGFTWNIDCYIVPRKAATLRYDFNLDSENTDRYIQGKDLPSPFISQYNYSTNKWQSTNVDDVLTVDEEYYIIKDGSDKDGFNYIFKGWNTKADGTGKMIDNTDGSYSDIVGNYKSGDSIYVAQDIVLYAQWEYAALKIEKVVETAANSETAPNDTFNFEVTIGLDNDKEFNYSIYNSNGTSDIVSDDTKVSSGKVKSKGTIGLKAGQYALVEAANGSSYTVSEISGSDTYWEYDSSTKSGTIQANTTAMCTFTNTYNKPLTADLTITKTGANTTLDPNQSFLFHVSGPNSFSMDVIIVGNGSVTIKDLPVGNYTVTEDESWSWRYTVSDGNGKTVTVNPSGKNSVTFNNTRDKTQWLDGNASAHNDFSKANGN